MKQTPPDGVHGVRPPLQDRSRDTYERILDAAERLLAARDFDALRVDEILAEADVSTGSFYARFADKEALLSALLARYREDLEQGGGAPKATAALPATLEARARAEVRQRIRRYRKRAGLIRTVALEYRRDPDGGAATTRLTRLAVRGLIEFFRPCLHEIGHADPERAILRGTYFVAAICRDRILFGRSPHASSVALPQSQLEDELTRLLIIYLRG